MSFLRVVAVFVCVVALLPASAFVPKDAEPRAWLQRESQPVAVERLPVVPGTESAAAQSAAAFLARYGGEWTFGLDNRTGRFSLIQGAGIPLIPGRGNELSPAALARLDLPDGEVTLGALAPEIRAFLEANADLLLPERGTLVLDGTSSLLRDDGRLISFKYDWFVDGIRVEEASVFVRINSGNITQLGAPLVGPIDLDTRTRVSSEEALGLLLDYTGDAEIARVEPDPELLVVIEEGGGAGIDHRLVWTFVYRILGGIETWEGRVDAHSGEIVGFRDLNRYARAVGGVYPRTVFEDNEITAPMPLLSVTVEGATVTGDTSGAYSYGGGEVASGLNGTFFDTNCDGCSNPPQPSVQIAGVGTGRIDFGLGGVDEIGNGSSTPADRNSFFHLNQVRRIAIKWLPDLGFLNQANFTSNVNIPSICNAVYTGDAVNFFRSGGDCNNTGEIADVMYHEYGHGIDLNSNGGDGATGEATSDVVSMHQTHSPLIGPGFRIDGDPVRNLDWTTSPGGLLTAGNLLDSCVCGAGQSCGPLGGEVHCEGEIYGQTHWDLSQALVAKHGHHTGWRVLERIFYLSLPDASGYLPSDSESVYDAYINADDDNGNLIDGTPNAQEIFDAFDLHEIAGSPAPSSPGCTRPAQPVLDATIDCDRVDLSWSEVADADHYEVFRTELLEDQAFFPLATVPSTELTFSDTEVAPGVEYWYVVMAVDGTGCESTVENPVAATLHDQPILSLTTAVDDDEPMGNRSGFADPGESVDVHLTLGNFGQTSATSLNGTMSSVSPGVTIELGQTDFDNLAPGASAENLDPLRFTTDAEVASCGDVLQFRFDPSGAEGCTAETSYFNLALGERVNEHFDDFETDQGWQFDPVSSTAATGAWVLGDPELTGYQPGNDVSDPGSQCWFTGSNPAGEDGNEDVDDGVVVLLSPVFDLSGQADLEVSYHRWFSMSEPGTDSGDFFKVEVSDDGGASWVELETLDHDSPAPSWTRRSFRLDDHVTLTNQIRFRVQAADGIADGSIIEAAFDEFSIERFVCDDTPACFEEPTFAGLEAAAPGASCGEIDLSWQAGVSNCVNAEITYNVYRSTIAEFTPGPENLVIEGWTSVGATDVLLDPGETYHYIVRAYDSRSGEDGNTAAGSAVAPAAPDISAPLFGGVETVVSGDFCGETVIGWSPALETCSPPVAYDIYRSTDPGFIPGPDSYAATTYATVFVDAGLTANQAYTYVVRARDDLGNADVNDVRISAVSGALDLTVFETAFEPDDGGWQVIEPNDATAGNWQWGDPSGTSYQPENDATAEGVNCWITGLSPNPGNGDVDDGTTTLLSARYDLEGAVSPVVRFAQWFTNDQGGSPGDATDTFKIDVSNDDGGTWTPLDEVGAGTPLAWVPVSHSIPLAATNAMRFRFTASDLGAGSLVEAGVDDFVLVDEGQGCSVDCGPNLPSVCSIHVSRSGDDIVLDWGMDPGRRVIVYTVGGCGETVLVGTVDGGTSFVHAGAALSSASFNYRVTTVNGCGVELPFCGSTDCP